MGQIRPGCFTGVHSGLSSDSCRPRADVPDGRGGRVAEGTQNARPKRTRK